MQEFNVYFPVLTTYLLYVLVPLVISGLIEELAVHTKLGQRIERWLFKKLGIDDKNK